MSQLDDEAVMFSVDVGSRLLAVRQAKGLSLEDVARLSRFSASAVGSWERGARTLSLPRLHEVAAFYDVPIGALIGDEQPPPAGHRRLVLDLDALKRIPSDAAAVQRFVRSIVVTRGDYNGRVLTIRHDDLPALCALLGVDSPAAAVKQLDVWGVLA